MAKAAGYGSTVEVSTDGGVTYTAIGGMMDEGFKCKGATLDVTNHDSGVYKEFIAGRLDLSFDLKGFYDFADAGQTVMQAAMIARTLIKLRYRPVVGTGQQQFILSCYLTGLDDDSPNEAANAINYTAQVTGAPSITTQ